MTWLEVIWKWVKGWGGYLLLALAALVPVAGWAWERSAHRKTMSRLEVAEDAASRAASVAEAERIAREESDGALGEYAARLAELEAERDAFLRVVGEKEDRIDAHAGDVDAVAEDLNKELGRGKVGTGEMGEGAEPSEEVVPPDTLPVDV